MRPLTHFAALLCLTAGLACGGDSTSPTANLTGNWSGTISSQLAGPGTFVLTFVESSSSLSGTWSTTFSNTANNNAGSLSGTASGSSVTLTLTPSDPQSCPFHVTGVMSGTVISGTYAAFPCTVAESGTFSASKH
jgi:hypothetical protein